MEQWNRQKRIKLFWKLQKGEGLSWFLEILEVVIMSMAIYLFLFFSQLYQIFMGNLQQGTGDLGSILGFSQKSLPILMIGCIFIGVFTLQSLCYFRSVKNQRRSAVLRVLGLNGKWKRIFDWIESLVVVLISFLPSFVGAKVLFLLTAREITHTEQIPVQGGSLLLSIFFVSFSMILLLMVNYPIAEFSEMQKSIGEQLRGSEHKNKKDEKRKQNRLYCFFLAIYLIILCLIAKQIELVLAGTAILFLLGFCNYKLGYIGIHITESFITQYRKKKRAHADFYHIALKTGGMKNRKNVFLITVLATGLLLFYFLSSLDWGLENFLERFWIQSKQTNLYLDVPYGQEQKMEEWLLIQGFPYQKLYWKELEEEGLALAVSEGNDPNASYFVQEGYLKTIPYNFYRWGVSTGDSYSLSGREFLIDEPEKEEGFSLIQYTCLVSYEDWKEQLDETYIVAFVMYADKKMLAAIASWAEEMGVEMMTSSRYINMLKQIYAPYLRILEVILLILSFSILLFLFVSILSSMIAREKEFFVYRGCGISWSRIRGLVLVQYLYSAFLGSIVSAFLYGIIFNGFKLLFFGNTTVYFVGIKQILLITILVFSLIGIECYLAMRFIQKRNTNVTLQLRAE